MKKRKSSLLQRILAVLLSAVLVTAMVANAAPMTVLAQENTESPVPGVQQKSTGENTVEAVEGGYTEQKEGTETEPAEETNPEEQEPDAGAGQEIQGPDAGAEQETPEPNAGAEQETPEPNAGTEQEIQEPQEPGAGAEQETPGTVTEEGTEQETVSGNDAEPEIMEAPQRAIMAAEPAPQSDNIASGKDWVLDGDGKLTISSDEGMTEWRDAGKPAYYQNVTGVEIQSGVTSIKIKAFAECSSLESVTIPSSVTSIGMGAFTGCSSLKSVTIPGSVTSIGIDAFNGCSSLESVTIPSSVTSIGMGAFTGCSSLKSVTIPSSVTSIESGAFSECSSLESVTIPESVTSIGASAFENCKRLVRVTMAGKNPPTISNRLFYGSPCGQSNTKGIYVPVCDYLVADRWSSYKSSIVVEAHTGDVSYSASGSRITQKCGKCNTVFGTATLSLSGTNFTYTGNAITPVSVTYADSGTDAWSGEKPTAITYADNTNAGTAKASLTIGAGETAATASLSFTIQPKALTDSMVTLPADSFPHTGNAVTPEVTVRDGGTALTKDADYTVSYTGNSNVGTAAVTVTGKGNYRGAITKNFQIVESDTDKVAAAKTVVEAAIDGITATNATTDTEILDVINAALSNAGIAGVTVAIDKFRTFKASASAAGHIEGVISIICGQAAESVNMEKPIAQLTAEKYTVTVNNGMGGGEYEAGATVTITADAPASGKQFDRWEVNSGSATLVNATSSTTTFAMPAGAVSVTAAYKDITEEHAHDYGQWQHDAAQHWKTCSCGDVIDRGNHSFGDWITDREATAAEAGTRHRECQTCHYWQTETIPATGTEPGTGTVTPEVKPGANAPATDISTPAEELKNMLLTDGEKQQVQNGTDIRIVLEVQDAGNTVSASDRTAIQRALNGFTVGQYLNIDLYKLVGADRTNITETAKKIRIVITVPDSLKNADSSKTRTFAVIRVHDGRAELLADLDDSADTITIETDRFSTYAVVNKDAANGGSDGENSGDDAGNGGGNDNGNNGNDSSSSDNSSQNNSDKNDKKPDSSKDSEPKTGDNTHLELYATLAMISGFAYLLLYFTDKDRGMTEETKKELVSRLIGWAKRGGKIRKWLALAAIFVLLVYYHSIGKKTGAEWKKIYEE